MKYLDWLLSGFLYYSVSFWGGNYYAIILGEKCKKTSGVTFKL